MSKDTKKYVVPHLRFPEFRNAMPWEAERLGNLLNYERPDKYIVQSDKYETSGIPVLTANKSFILGYTSEQYGIYKDVPAIIFDDFTTDKKYVDFPFKIKSSAIKILKSNGKNDIRFLFELMTIIKFDPQQHKRYYISEYQNIIVFVPKPKEQQKIAACLSSIDEVIELESKKLDAFKAHKKGLMQQLFPREGETTPRMRFPEFRNAGPWEMKRLGDVFHERNERNGSELELLSVTISDGVVKASQLDRKNNTIPDLSNYKKVYPNDIVYNSMRMWQGASGVSKWHGIVSPAYTVVKPMENHNSLFWAYYFKLSESIEKFARYSQGVTSDTWNLKFPAFSVIRMATPSLPEQQKIANFLSPIDEIIELQAKKIEALKTHKKGLMQQLFPQEVD